MKCPNCTDTKLDVTHVYLVEGLGETRDLRCRTCGFKASSVSFLVKRPQRRTRGDGGMALKRELERGKLKLRREG